MGEYQGQYGKAKVMIDSIDQTTVSQIYNFLNHEAFTNPISIMPDTHAGAGAVIGFTMEMTDKVIPNVVGVDIGCGMLSENIGKRLFTQISKKDLDINIRQLIPFGTSVHKTYQFNVNKHSPFWEEANYKLSSLILNFNNKYGTSYIHQEFNPDWLKKKCKDIDIEYDRVLNSVGTLGGGNHFIEVGESTKTGDYWITVHTGSRQFGFKIAKYWQTKAGKGALAFLENEDVFGYLVDMLFAQIYANENRNLIQNLIHHNITQEDVKESISCVHNFIDFDDFIIRKGAIRSYKGEKMIIPFNMEDGILICEGKSNKEWNYSAPHGAGRVGSRTWAKQNLDLNKAKENMENKNIYVSNIPHDEIKDAYKDPKIIEDAIEPTATIIDRVKPVISIKD